MNFEQILSAYKSKACILSVETYPGGGYGNIRIVEGNQGHYDEMARVMHRPFVPDSPYEQYLPQNMNFEDFCYRSAILGQPHAYLRTASPDGPLAEHVPAAAYVGQGEHRILRVYL